MKQVNIFELTKPKYKITKPIRLIELFAGIGSQAKALKNIGANFEHYRAIDFDKFAIKSYNAIHNTNFTPLDITKITAKDLGVVETDKYDYLMTYSFPCQDLSLAGKGAGMKKGGGTRSGLLWEVERLLSECETLPQILLMENVTQVHGRKHLTDFNKWLNFLEELGYKNYWADLNAKDYGMPQNRNRCFMVSILGDYYYEFPHKRKLKLRLKDMLEDEVDEKYYLSDKMLKCWTDTTNRNGYVRADKFKPINPFKQNISYTLTGSPGNRPSDNFILDIKGNDQIKRVYSDKGLSPTLITDKTLCLNSKVNGKQPKIQDRIYDSEGVSTAITTSFMPSIAMVMDDRISNIEKLNLRQFHGNIYIDEKDRAFIKTAAGFVRIRKLTPKECWRLMGFSDEDFEKAEKVNSNSQLYKQAGNSIVVKVLERIFEEFI